MTRIENAMPEEPWKKMLDWMAVLSKGESPFPLRFAVEVFERSIASAQLDALSEALSFSSVVTKNDKHSYIQVHMSYKIGNDGFLKWDQHGQIIFVEINLRTRLPFRWLWEESLDFDNIKGDLREKAFKQIRNTTLFAACEDTHPLSSHLGNYGNSKAMEMYSEMIPAMIDAGVFPSMQDCDTRD